MMLEINKLIIEVAKEINTGSCHKISVEDGKDTPLFGKGGILDSLGLVNLIVAIEQRVEDEFNVGITLADERAISQENSPFRTIQTLAEYICMLIEEQKNDKQ